VKFLNRVSTSKALDILYYNFENETIFGINLLIKRQIGLEINVFV
jgi:hypothetical protein